jgi:hypothetical protein
MDVAIEDAVVSTTHTGQPFLFSVASPDSARPDAAAAQAAHDTLAALYPSAKPQVDQLLSSELAAIPRGPATDEGVRVGATVARILVSLRATDGSAATPPPFVAGTQPGNYRSTPPNFPAPQFTNWGTVTPFVLKAADQFRPGPPPALTSQAYTNAFNEVKSLGQDTSTTRTADETQAARFWAPPIWTTWNEIAANLVTQQRTDLERTAQIFSDLNVTFADTAIALYDAKYTYHRWRPITAITATNQGNSNTVADPTWVPLANTANDPSYPGAHAEFSEAAATVLGDFFRMDDFTFSLTNSTVGITRSFDSFTAAADEAAASRIFAGQHFRYDEDAGQSLGAQAADFVVDKALLPLTNHRSVFDLHRHGSRTGRSRVA